MELAAHWHRYQNLPKKRVNTLLLYRERDDPVKERLANWRTRSGTLGSVEERYTGALHGRTSKILATWQIDSYPRQADAYLCLKRAIYRRFERKIGRISCPTFRGKVMSQNGFRAKLCFRETAFDSSIQAHWTGDFMSQKWRIYGLSDMPLTGQRHHVSVWLGKCGVAHIPRGHHSFDSSCSNKQTFFSPQDESRTGPAAFLRGHLPCRTRQRLVRKCVSRSVLGQGCLERRTRLSLFSDGRPGLLAC